VVYNKDEKRPNVVTNGPLESRRVLLYEALTSLEYTRTNNRGKREKQKGKMSSIASVNGDAARLRVTINCDMGEGYGSWKMVIACPSSLRSPAIACLQV
jgi:hypothetical protein